MVVKTENKLTATDVFANVSTSETRNCNVYGATLTFKTFGTLSASPPRALEFPITFACVAKGRITICCDWLGHFYN